MCHVDNNYAPIKRNSVRVNYHYEIFLKVRIFNIFNVTSDFIWFSFCLQEVGLTSMRICVDDLTGRGSKHDPLFVSYVVIGGWYYISLVKKGKVVAALFQQFSNLQRSYNYLIHLQI